MFDVVLVRGEIPGNAGNVIRLCANSGASLHLVRPLGFSLDDAHLRRAGLDYREMANVLVHNDFDGAMSAVCAGSFGRAFAFSPIHPSAADALGGARRYDEVCYRAGDALVFGGESAGLPSEILAQFAAENRLYIPMRAGSRSMNLSNAVAVAVMEAWRQCGFAGAGV